MKSTETNAAELTLQIDTLESQARHLAEGLPYAEGQAYRDEQRTLSSLRQKIGALKKQRADIQE